MTASARFPPEPVSVPEARRFVRATLESLGLIAAWDAAQMLVSEVATNAVLHARTDFTVSVVQHGDRVRVNVVDLSPAMPRARSYGVDSTTGRGMRLLGSLALTWGVDPEDVGKTVWFEVLADGDDGTLAEPWDSEIDLDLNELLAGFDDIDPVDGSVQSPSAFRDAA